MLLLLAVLEFGLIGSIYDDQIKTDFGYQLKVGKNIYAWGSYESPRYSILGQPMSNFEIIGYGLGVKKSWGKTSVFLEYGIFDPSVDPNPIVRHEVVNRSLINDFGTPPLVFRESSYDLKKDYGGRIGVGYELTNHLKATFAYRYFNAPEEMDAWTGQRHIIGETDCVCWWQERGTLDLSSVEFGLSIRF